MSLLVWILLISSQLALVVGQILLKKAMSRREMGLTEIGVVSWVWVLSSGIFCLTLWFLLWIGLMHQVDLSQLMPMEGVSPLLIVLGGIFFLGEKFTWRGWVGIILTCLGVTLVSLS